MRDSVTIHKSGTSAIILALSLIVPSFWFLEQIIDVYQVAVIGAIYEILWLPMLISIFALPVISFIYWRKNKFSIRSLYLYSLLISIATLVLLLITAATATITMIPAQTSFINTL